MAHPNTPPVRRSFPESGTHVPQSVLWLQMNVQDRCVSVCVFMGLPISPLCSSVSCGGEVSVRVRHCLPCLSLSMWWQSLSAGPSFRPMYFITMSLLSNIRALPSISCRQSFTWLTLSLPNTEFYIITETVAASQIAYYPS